MRGVERLEFLKCQASKLERSVYGLGVASLRSALATLLEVSVAYGEKSYKSIQIKQIYFER